MSRVDKMTDDGLDVFFNDAKKIGRRKAVQAIADWCERNMDTAMNGDHMLVDVVPYDQMMDALRLLLNSE